MGESLMRSVALFGMVALAVLFLVELRRWRSIGAVIGRQHRILRVVLIALIEVVLAMIVVGPLVTSRHHPLAALIYWMVCVLLVLAVFVLAIVDLWAVTKGYMMLNRDLFGGTRRDGRREK